MAKQTPATWFRVRLYRPFIEPVEVIKMTEGYIQRSPGDWEPTVSWDGSYFPTWAEAYKHLEEKFRIRVDTLKHNLAALEAALEEIQSMESESY
jgi:hypothetical protein